jgi:hypothetical protein
MKLLQILALFHNWLSDKDFIWWPFSFLRPEPKELMTLKHTSLMTACFGGLSFMMFTVLAVANSAFTIESSFLTFLACFIGFFLWFNLITKPLWNIRARELSK